MLRRLARLWDVPEIWRHVLATLGLLAAFRLGSWIPLPRIDTSALGELFLRSTGDWLGLVDTFSGGSSLARATVFALGIVPYISASIVVQLLTATWPFLERVRREGEAGRRRIARYTRYGAVVLAVAHSLFVAAHLERVTLAGELPIVHSPGWGFKLMTVLSLTTGATFVMWLGERITDRRIGNGMSLLVFAGIVAGFPGAVHEVLTKLGNGQLGLLATLLLSAAIAGVTMAVVFVERGQRRIAVQYPRRAVGRRAYGGQSSHLPLRVNASGVVPVIFASSMLALPQAVASYLGTEGGWLRAAAEQLQWGYPLYNPLNVGLIVFFCHFYTSIVFDPGEVAENVRRHGGIVPGIRPGRQTAEAHRRGPGPPHPGGGSVPGRDRRGPGADDGGLQAGPDPGVGPWLDVLLHDNGLGWITEGLGLDFYFGGTALLIVVGVAMDTASQAEAQLLMSHYDGLARARATKVRDRRPA